jgi:hypothetical protein
MQNQVGAEDIRTSEERGAKSRKTEGEKRRSPPKRAYGALVLQQP